VVESGDKKLVPSEGHLERVPCERWVSGVSIDASDPLHDVQRPHARVQPEVGALGELVGIQRVEWEFFGREVSDADMLGLDRGEQVGESLEVCAVWVGDDVEVPWRARIRVRRRRCRR
jgi:hypothetical protein